MIWFDVKIIFTENSELVWGKIPGARAVVGDLGLKLQVDYSNRWNFGKKKIPAPTLDNGKVELVN